MTKTAFSRAFPRIMMLIGLLFAVQPATHVAQASQNPLPSDPIAFVEDFGELATDVLADKSLTPLEREQAFRDFMVSHFHIDVITRFVLGKHYRRMSEDQREAFRSVYEDYVLAIYVRRLENYNGEQLQVGTARPHGDREMLVSSRIYRPEGLNVRVTWRLRKDGESWRIIDAVIEGVSMAITQRAEIDSVIRNNGGIDGLLVNLHEVVAKAQTASSEPAKSEAAEAEATETEATETEVTEAETTE